MEDDQEGTLPNEGFADGAVGDVAIRADGAYRHADHARRVDRLDLEPVVFKLVRPDPEERGLTLYEADQDIGLYRCFLKLCALYPGVSVVPTMAIDRVWHAHMLDTAKYRADCLLVFGRFLDHFPYAGLRGEEDRLAWLSDFARTRALFREHFGVELGGEPGASVCRSHAGGADCCVGCIASSAGTARPRPERPRAGLRGTAAGGGLVAAVADEPPEPGWAAAVDAQLRQVFPGEECQLRVARRWLAASLPGCPVLGDVVSIVTELGSNAILHSATGRDGKFAVEVTHAASGVLVAVTDDGGRASRGSSPALMVSTGGGWSWSAACPRGWAPWAAWGAGRSGPGSTGTLMSTDPGLQPGRSPRTAPPRPRGEPGGGRRAAAAVGRRPPGTRPPGQPGLVRPRPPAPGLGRRRLGRELRLLREARSLRLADVADRLGVAPSTLSRIESGKAPTRTGYLALMLDLYDVADPGQRAGLTDLARQGRRDGWWTDYSDVLPAAARHWLSLEAAATSLRGYCLQTVPDLLQVPGYTTAAIKAAQPGLDPGQVGRLAVVTQRRQHGLLDGGCQVHLLVDESALVRAVAGAGVMTGQLQQVLDLAARPAVTVQVVAMTTPQVVLSRPFTVLGFPDPADGDVVSYGGEGGPVTVSRGAGDAREALDTFGALARAALSPADSAEFIAGLIRAT